MKRWATSWIWIVVCAVLAVSGGCAQNDSTGNNTTTPSDAPLPIESGTADAVKPGEVKPAESDSANATVSETTTPAPSADESDVVKSSGDDEAKPKSGGQIFNSLGRALFKGSAEGLAGETDDSGNDQ